MSFDLADFDTYTHAEKGVPMPLVHPKTRAPVLRDDKVPVTITLLGRHSEAFRDALREIQEARADMNGRGITITPAMKEKEDVDTLIACTRDWTFGTLDKQDFPCTPANIVKFWNDQRFRSLREIAMNFILQDGNFLAPSSGHSDAMPGASSSSTVPSLKVARSEPRSAATA